MVQIIKDIIGYSLVDLDWLFALWSCIFLFLGVQFFFSLLTVPINMITNGFERVISRGK